MLQLNGIFPAITTPFTHDGEVYKAKIRHNVEKWNQTTVSGYLVCGLAGEGPLLSETEKIFVWGEVAAAAPGKILLADCSAESVRQSLHLAQAAASLGYTAAYVRAPNSYPQLSDEALYFSAVADQSKIPVLAPASASQHPNLLPARPIEDASQLAGGLKAGRGCAILDYASAAPFSAITIFEANLKREYDAAEDWQRRLFPALALIQQHGIAALKYAMDFNGYYGGIVRLPLRPLPLAARAEIESALHGLRG